MSHNLRNAIAFAFKRSPNRKKARIYSTGFIEYVFLLFKMYWPNVEREFYEHIFIAFPNDVTMFGK